MITITPELLQSYEQRFINATIDMHFNGETECNKMDYFMEFYLFDNLQIIHENLANLTDRFICEDFTEDDLFNAVYPKFDIKPKYKQIKL